MPGTPAYMVIGTTENVSSGDELSSKTDYYRAGLFLTSSAAENALGKIKVPAKYMFLSILKVTVNFYVCVSSEIDDEEMARKSRTDPKYLPPVAEGPFDSVEQAEMSCLLIDRNEWRGALVIAMTADGAKKASRV